MIALNLNPGLNFIYTHKSIQIEINFINTGSFPFQKDTINYCWRFYFFLAVYIFPPSSSWSALDNAACANQIPCRCVTAPLSSSLLTARPAPGCSYQAKYRGTFVCMSRARIFSLEFSFLLSSHPPSDTSWHFSCRQSKATAFLFFPPFCNGCSFSNVRVVGEGDVISTANTAQQLWDVRGSFRMKIGLCQPSCVSVSMTKQAECVAF